MAECTAIAPMTMQEASKCVTDIRRSLGNIRTLLLDLYHRAGWKALGYKSWRECIKQEFGSKESTMYQQLHAAQVEVNISAIAEITNPAQPAKPLPETHARHIASLSPEKQREVYQRAADKTGGKPTEAVIKEEAKAEKQKMTRQQIDALPGPEMLRVYQESEKAILEDEAENDRKEAAEARAKRIDRALFYLGKAQDMLTALEEEGGDALSMLNEVIATVQQFNAVR